MYPVCVGAAAGCDLLTVTKSEMIHVNKSAFSLVGSALSFQPLMLNRFIFLF